MAMFIGYPVESDLPVYATVHMYTGQVTISKVPEKTRPCITGHHVVLYPSYSSVPVSDEWEGRFPVEGRGTVDDYGGVAGRVPAVRVGGVAHLQGHQLNMAVFSGTLKKVTCPVYASVHVYTGKVTFNKVQEIHGQV